MKELFQTLQQRKRPEDVAEMIRGKMEHSFDRNELKTLDKAAGKSLKRTFQKFTSMLENFHRPVTPERQMRKAIELFRRTGNLNAAECADAERVEAFIKDLCPLIGKKFGASDFKKDRLNDEQRKTNGFDFSRRRYNKLFRLLVRLEAKLQTYLREQKKYEFTRIGKSRFATHLTWEEFSKDAASAAFIAYYTARCNVRSVFTKDAQQRPYDEVADMLFQRLLRNPAQTNWWAVAHVHPDRAVLEQLPDYQRGLLLGNWLKLLHALAEMLREVWAEGNIERTTMIVRKGNDSSTWNNTANAWNRARSAWVALLHSMGMEAELDRLCFGKVLRLMAADVAAWHRASGGELEPDTKVWCDLPLPWEVLSESGTCTRSQVEEVCRRHKVDPIKKGWIAPPPERRVEPFQPTPELVHGVAVATPELAFILRKAGWFSGKWGKVLPEAISTIAVIRDEHGFALGAAKIDSLTGRKTNEKTTSSLE